MKRTCRKICFRSLHIPGSFPHHVLQGENKPGPHHYTGKCIVTSGKLGRRVQFPAELLLGRPVSPIYSVCWVQRSLHLPYPCSLSERHRFHSSLPSITLKQFLPCSSFESWVFELPEVAEPYLVTSAAGSSWPHWREVGVSLAVLPTVLLFEIQRFGLGKSGSTLPCANITAIPTKS